MGFRHWKGLALSLLCNCLVWISISAMTNTKKGQEQYSVGTRLAVRYFGQPPHPTVCHFHRGLDFPVRCWGHGRQSFARYVKACLPNLLSTRLDRWPLFAASSLQARLLFVCLITPGMTCGRAICLSPLGHELMHPHVKQTSVPPHGIAQVHLSLAPRNKSRRYGPSRQYLGHVTGAAGGTETWFFVSAKVSEHCRGW